MLRTVTPSNTLPAFHATFVCVGIITAASAWIFAQLAPEIRGRAQHKTDPSERA
jgi:hypothetical protein